MWGEYPAELPSKLRTGVLLMEKCGGNGALFEDAEAPAAHAGPRPETVGYKDYVSAAMAQSPAEQAAPGRA